MRWLCRQLLFRTLLQECSTCRYYYNRSSLQKKLGLATSGSRMLFGLERKERILVLVETCFDERRLWWKGWTSEIRIFTLKLSLLFSLDTRFNISAGKLLCSWVGYRISKHLSYFRLKNLWLYLLYLRVPYAPNKSKKKRKRLWTQH